MDTTTVPNAPRPDTRESRALALYRERRQDIVLIGRDTYEVPSQDGTRVYEVVYGGEVETCTCPDAWRHPDLNCKHLLAVAVKMAKRRGQSARRTPDHELIREDAAPHGKETQRRCRTCGGFGYFGWGAQAPRNCPACPSCKGTGKVA